MREWRSELYICRIGLVGSVQDLYIGHQQDQCYPSNAILEANLHASAMGQNTCKLVDARRLPNNQS